MSSCLLRRQLQAASSFRAHTADSPQGASGPNKTALVKTWARVHTSSAGEICSVLGASSGFILGRWHGEWLEPHEQRKLVPLLSWESSAQLEAGAQVSSVSYCGRWGRRTPSPEMAAFTNSVWGLVCFPNAYFISLAPPPGYIVSSVRTIEKQVSLYNWIF